MTKQTRTKSRVIYYVKLMNPVVYFLNVEVWVFSIRIIVREKIVCLNSNDVNK